jgi:hypothetical protein
MPLPWPPFGAEELDQFEGIASVLVLALRRGDFGEKTHSHEPIANRFVIPESPCRASRISGSYNPDYEH